MKKLLTTHWQLFVEREIRDANTRQREYAWMAFYSGVKATLDVLAQADLADDRALERELDELFAERAIPGANTIQRDYVWMAFYSGVKATLDVLARADSADDRALLIAALERELDEFKEDLRRRMGQMGQ